MMTEKFNIGVHRKIQCLGDGVGVGGGGGIDMGGCLRVGAWTVCRFKRVLVKKRGWSL